MRRIEAMKARLNVTGRRSVQVPLEPMISVVMLEMLVNNFFGGNVGYDELRERYVPALTYSIDHMIRHTIAHRVRVVGDLLTGRQAKAKRAQAAFEALTDIALSGRKTGTGLWGEFKSDASDAALRSTSVPFWPERSRRRRPSRRGRSRISRARRRYRSACTRR